MAKADSVAEIAAELEKEKIRTTMLNMKLLLMDYNMILPRLRIRDYKEIALKDIKKMRREIEAADWPSELRGQIKELESLLEKLLKPIEAEDFTRFQPIHNAVKKSFEALEEKSAELTMKKTRRK